MIDLRAVAQEMYKLSIINLCLDMKYKIPAIFSWAESVDCWCWLGTAFVLRIIKQQNEVAVKVNYKNNSDLELELLKCIKNKTRKLPIQYL